jgi:hypothetical protein
VNQNIKNQRKSEANPRVAEVPNLQSTEANPKAVEVPNSQPTETTPTKLTEEIHPKAAEIPNFQPKEVPISQPTEANPRVAEVPNLQSTEANPKSVEGPTPHLAQAASNTPVIFEAVYPQTPKNPGTPRPLAEVTPPRHPQVENTYWENASSSDEEVRKRHTFPFPAHDLEPFNFLLLIKTLSLVRVFYFWVH